jgi:hypothetical protein
MPALTFHKAAQSLFPRSNGVALLLSGDPDVRTLALEFAAVTLTEGGDVLWVEAANRFDLYAFTETAKRWGLNPQPYLRRLHIARAFTLYQLDTLCTDGLDAALGKHPDALTVLSDPLALCWDADIPGAEARRVVTRLAHGIRRLRQRGHRLVMTSADPPEPFRHRAGLLALLEPVATRAVVIRAVDGGVLLMDAPAPSTPQLFVRT